MGLGCIKKFRVATRFKLGQERCDRFRNVARRAKSQRCTATKLRRIIVDLNDLGLVGIEVSIRETGAEH